VPLKGDVVEVGQALRQRVLRELLALLDDVLLLVPVPLAVDLSEVLDDERVDADAGLLVTEYADAFSMDPEVPLLALLVLKVFDRVEDNAKDLLVLRSVLLAEDRVAEVRVDDVPQRALDVVAELALLLDREVEFLRDEHLPVDVPAVDDDV
jgi:hypothetical protein